MTIVIVAMLVGFAIAGICLLAIFIPELARKLGRRPYLARADGPMVEVVSKPMSFGVRNRTRTIMHFPLIAFAKADGVSVTFTSEVGDGGRTCRYSLDQRINVLYDPIGEVPPTIDSWSGV